MISVDNSEWMRNGDYIPSRLEAQVDAVNLICGAKTSQNAENTVAVLTMAGKTEVLVSLTSDLGKVLSALHSVKIANHIDLLSALQVAQLALKNRQNKNQHQRMIVFVGSPVTSDKGTLVRMGKRLKKNNVAVDIVDFSNDPSNEEKLSQLVSAVNSNDTSHIVVVPPGPHILSDALMATPIILGSDAVSAGGSGVDSASAAYGGVDPNLDPELALALRVSLEEERARQEAEAKKQSSATTATATPTESAVPSTKIPTPTTTNTTVSPTKDVTMKDVGEDADLEQALAMSMEGVTETTAPQTSTPQPSQPSQPSQPPQPQPSQAYFDELSEEEQMELDFQMSLQTQAEEKATPTQNTETNSEKKESSNEVTALVNDPDFLNSILTSLPGVDPNDVRIQNVLQDFKQETEKANKDEEKKK